jgi:MFS superfamily sulfate permease-like transporter
MYIEISDIINIVLTAVAIATLLVSIIYNRKTNKQNEEVTKQNREMHEQNKTIQEKQIQIALFEKRYEIFEFFYEAIMFNKIFFDENRIKFLTMRDKIITLFDEKTANELQIINKTILDYDLYNTLPDYTSTYTSAANKEAAYAMYVIRVIEKIIPSIKLSE